MKSVMQHNFSQIPSVRVPRSVFNRTSAHKTTFNSGMLIPIFTDEVLPGDTFNMNAQVMARMITPIAPIMDNLFLDTFYFAVPNRLIWDNWEDFITGNAQHTVPLMEQQNLQPQTLGDYFGIPTGIATAIDVNALYYRAYNLIYNEWFRCEYLINEVTVDTDDGPDAPVDYELLKRGKRPDYFTSALPWPQKGAAITLPIGSSAPVYGTDYGLQLDQLLDEGYMAEDSSGNIEFRVEGGNDQLTGDTISTITSTNINRVLGVTSDTSIESGLYADLSTATASTINQIRESFQLQRMLERDARGGTRYTETIRSHYGVVSPDSRMQRPEYLGGSTARINITPIPQTSESATTEQGNLAGYGIVHDGKGRFNKSFTEHCVIIGIACVRADLTYQQGLNRQWSRQTRYDYYWPSLANLGEQEVLNKEIYQDGTAADNQVFGYQERYAEYRYKPSIITGKMRSNDPQSLDLWHLSQEFGTLPTLGQTFIEEDVPIDRVTAVTNEPEFKFDSLFQLKCVRPMPTYSIPGMVDHF